MTVIPAYAEEFSAGTVMKKMEPKERFAFISGIVEGLALARFRSDDSKPEGATCIYDWFYGEDGTSLRIEQAFEKFPDKPPANIVDAMIRRRCGA